jgi:hypothetical protein
MRADASAPLHVHVASEAPGPLEDHYFIAKLAWHWQRRGVRVTSGPVDSLDADLGIVHVNRTRVADADVPRNPRRVPLLNERVRDISKTLFSTLRVRRGDDWRGPVIVKANLNYYGEPEARSRPPGAFERARTRWAERNWRRARRLPPMQYPILPSQRDVPRWVWRDRELIVERFVPEREGDLYAIRGWVFFGSQGYCYRLFSSDPVVKTYTRFGHEFLDDEPPVEIAAVRKQHGFDFGKFDWVVSEGRPILLDANKTPWVSSPPDTPRLTRLADALREFLPEYPR